MEDVLQSGFCESSSGYYIVDWFVDEIIEIEKKMLFYFKNTKNDIIMTQEHEEDYRNKNISRFCEKILSPIKVEITVT